MSTPTLDSQWPALDPTGRAISLDRFDPARDSWAPITPTARVMTEALDNLEVATWNIWFSEWRKRARLELLLEILQQHTFDCIALQEVTHDALHQISACEWVRQRYAITGAKGESIHGATGYGVVMLLALERARSARATLHEIPSNQGRRVLAVHLDEGCVVLDTHLESMRPNGMTREDQMRDVQAIFAREERLIWMGDFNFAPDFEEQATLATSLTDAWVAARQSAPGYTIDTTRNPNFARTDPTRAPKRARYDRIVCRGFDVTRCVILGDEPTRGHDAALRASDHYGLHATVIRRARGRTAL